MSIPFRTMIFAFAIITGVITSYSVFADEPKYDRLDGRGASGTKVDVIEWEGNLEIHTYPRGSMKALGAKVDDRVEGKKVMVIAYEFKGQTHPLVRRAILGVPFDAKNLKAYIDPTEKEFDKLALTNQTLTKPWVRYKLAPAPKQWFPDGDHRNTEESVSPIPLSQKPADPQIQTETNNSNSKSQRKPASVETQENDGAIKSFSW